MTHAQARRREKKPDEQKIGSGYGVIFCFVTLPENWKTMHTKQRLKKTRKGSDRLTTIH